MNGTGSLRSHPSPAASDAVRPAPASRKAAVPHARTWQAVRVSCARRTGKDCGYPFCACLPLAEVA